MKIFFGASILPICMRWTKAHLIQAKFILLLAFLACSIPSFSAEPVVAYVRLKFQNAYDTCSDATNTICMSSWVVLNVKIDKLLAGNEPRREVLAGRFEHCCRASSQRTRFVAILDPIIDPEDAKAWHADYRIREIIGPSYCFKEPISQYGLSSEKARLENGMKNGPACYSDFGWTEEDERRSQPVTCREFDIDIKRKDWPKARQKMHLLAIDDGLIFNDKSSQEAGLYATINTRGPFGSDAYGHEYSLISESETTGPTKFIFYSDADHCDSADGHNGLYDAAVRAFSQDWKIHDHDMRPKGEAWIKEELKGSASY